ILYLELSVLNHKNRESNHRQAGDHPLKTLPKKFAVQVQRNHFHDIAGDVERLSKRIPEKRLRAPCFSPSPNIKQQSQGYSQCSGIGDQIEDFFLTHNGNKHSFGTAGILFMEENYILPLSIERNILLKRNTRAFGRSRRSSWSD